MHVLRPWALWKHEIAKGVRRNRFSSNTVHLTNGIGEVERDAIVGRRSSDALPSVERKFGCAVFSTRNPHRRATGLLGVDR